MVGHEYTPLVLKPTAAEVLGTSFEDYITKHEKKILAAGGICKIVMPQSLTPRKAGYDDLGDLTIQRAIKQEAIGSKGLYRMVYVEQKPLSWSAFKAMATDPHNLPSTSGAGRSGNTDNSDLERKFWKNVTIKPPLYGADVPGSLWDESFKGWNLRRLDTILSSVLNDSGHKLLGVNTPYLYFGQWRSVFAWHTEDMDLYSVNYVHFGAPKQWYVIPPEHSKRFEYVIKSQLPEAFKVCAEFLRHKELLVSPQFLDQYQVPYVKVTQHPREFVITYPGAYHAGFNQGYNCAESVNFATKRWIPIGARAGVCTCQKDAVRIDMRLFRDLVPANQLPEELFQDTSDEDESDEESGSDDEANASDSNDSTTEVLAHTSRKRGRTAGPSNAAAGKQAKATRAAAEDDAASARRRAPASAARKPATEATPAAAAVDERALLAQERAAQAEKRRLRAAHRAGRLSVRERIAMRSASVRRLATSPPPAPTAPVAVPAPAAKTRAAATPAATTTRAAAPAPKATTRPTTSAPASKAAAPTAAPTRQRGARVLQTRAGSTAPATAPSARTRPHRVPVLTAKMREALDTAHSEEEDERAVVAPATAPTARRARGMSVTVPADAAAAAEERTSNHSAATAGGAPADSDGGAAGPSAPAPPPAAPALSPRSAVAGLLSVLGIQLNKAPTNPPASKPSQPAATQPATTQADEATRASARRAAAAAAAAGTDSKSGKGSRVRRPKRKTAGVNRWFSSNEDFELDDSKW